MNTLELVTERVKSLSETEAQNVLVYLNHVQQVAPTARELRRMPREEREKILGAQAAEAEAHYRAHPELIVEDVDPPMDYE